MHVRCAAKCCHCSNETFSLRRTHAPYNLSAVWSGWGTAVPLVRGGTSSLFQGALQRVGKAYLRNLRGLPLVWRSICFRKSPGKEGLWGGSKGDLQLSQIEIFEVMSDGRLHESSKYHRRVNVFAASPGQHVSEFTQPEPRCRAQTTRWSIT
eukprot:7930507-Pyramimonas_sp.AAC.1